MSDRDALQEYRHRLRLVEGTVMAITVFLWLTALGCHVFGYPTVGFIATLLALSFTLRGCWALGRWIFEPRLRTGSRPVQLAGHFSKKSDNG